MKDPKYPQSNLLNEKELKHYREEFAHCVLSEEEYNRDWLDIHEKIFNVGQGPNNTVCLPNPVFKPGYKLLFLDGGDIYYDSKDYNNFISCFRKFEENEYVVLEQKVTYSEHPNEEFIPDRLKFKVDIPYSEFKFAKEILVRYWPFGLIIQDYYVFGRSGNWAIYLSEGPDLMIIGVKPKFVEFVANKIGINGNGYTDDLDKFVQGEFRLPGAYEKFVENYLNDERIP